MSDVPVPALAISDVAVAPFPATLALMACPGARATPAGCEAVRHTLRRDIDMLKTMGVALVLSCLEAEELPLPESDVAQLFWAANIEWRLLPIPDMSAPDPALDCQLQQLLALAERYLERGRRVAIHCKAGLGRTGMVAARLLMRQGCSASAAIAAVRASHDQAAIETAAQIAYLQRSAADPLSRLRQ